MPEKKVPKTPKELYYEIYLELRNIRLALKEIQSEKEKESLELKPIKTEVLELKESVTTVELEPVKPILTNPKIVAA